MKKISLLLKSLILFFILTNNLTSQWSILSSEADSLVLQGANHIYNIEFEEAEEKFNFLIDKYPNHPSGYFLSAMVDWWKITLYRYTDKINKDFLRKIDKTIDVSEYLLSEVENDITGLFFKGGALGYRARFYSNEKEWFSAASDGKEAFEIMIESHKLAPGNHDIMLGTGIYNYFSEAIPESYPLLKPLVYFFPPGNKKIGLLQLRASMNYARYTKVEAQVTLMQIYYSFEKDFQQAHYYANDLFEKYPKNPYFHRYLGRCEVKLGNWQKIEDTWRDILKNCLKRKTGYDNLTAREALYYVGLALQRRKEYETAIRYLTKCIEVSEFVDYDEETGFLISAHVKLALLLDKTGKRKEAIKLYKQILKMKDYDNSHNTAKKYLENPYN